MGPNRSQKRSLYGPSIPDALGKRRSRKTKLFRQISADIWFAFVANNQIVTGISGLFRAGRPSTIRWRVGTIVVDAIQRFVGRPFSHIGQKVAELFPSSADRNAATSIMRVTIVRGIFTSFTHRLPRAIGGCADAILRMTMLGAALFNPTSARGRFPDDQVASSNPDNVSASAATHPHKVSWETVRLVKNSQTTECLSGKIIDWMQAMLSEETQRFAFNPSLSGIGSLCKSCAQSAPTMTGMNHAEL